MPIDMKLAEQLMAAKPEPVPFSYNDKDVMLYALGIGLGADPMNETELAFVYERNLKVVPTAATVLAYNASRGGGGGSVAQLKINYALVLHGEQKVTLHKPLPPSAEMTTESRLVGVYDKGKDKGAVLINETVWRDRASGDKMVTLIGSTFARGDGGFGGKSEGQPEPHPTPTRKPDLEVALTTRPDQALIYRLCGDRNPLHSDPGVAKAAGFPAPILHGLCTYGHTCRAILSTIAEYDPTRIKAHDVRFSSPVYPGETIVTRMWKDGSVVSFEASVKERDVTVIKNGRCIVE
jgi:acyl dehydratase